MTEKSSPSKKQMAQSRATRAAIVESYKKKSHTGGFSDIGYITTGPDADHTDTYVKAEATPSRYLGKNMMVKAPRSGTLPDVYFGKLYATLASSTQGNVDKYVDQKNPFRDHSGTKKFIQSTHKGRDFKMSNYPAPGTGSGAYGGTFQGKPFEHMPEQPTLKRGEASPKFEKFAAGNFKTRAGPKGTYGFPNTTFGKFASLYVATPEVIAQREKDIKKWEKKKEQFEKEKAELLKRPVFKGMSNFKDTFDAKKASGITSVFDQYEAPAEVVAAEEKAKKKRDKAAARKAKAEAKKSKPLNLPTFRYASTLKSGEAGYFNKFPDAKVSVDEAAEAKKEAKRAKREAKAKKAAKKKGIKELAHPVWKPVSWDKSSVFASLLPRYY
eukprot:GILJ01013901.1.p1 GENE.GILJ01013901.1~~GILJ01013901.1.p1  ORF type:complete len:383 (+),score=80.78 GILJ01013901.1:35-1183(+)